MSVRVQITELPLDTASALEYCADHEHGAANLFVGRVRNHNLGRAVVAVSYDIHLPMCRAVFNEICAEARRRWEDDLRLWLAHRQGRVTVGEASVVAAASSAHREEAFNACRYLVEQMKYRAPIWKREHYTDGASEWVHGHVLCGHD